MTTNDRVECPTCPYYGCRDRCKHPATPTPPKETTMPDLTDLVRDLAAALAHLDDAKQRVDDLKEQVRQHPAVADGGPDKYAAGDVTLIVSTNRRFDPKKAMPLIPQELLPLVTHAETVVDRDKLKALLPDVFEQAQVEGSYRVGLS